MENKPLDKLIEAEDILLDVYYEIRDKRGYTSEAKRLDSILGKLNNLQHLIKTKG